MNTLPDNLNECQEIVLDLDTASQTWTSHLITDGRLCLDSFEQGNYDLPDIYRRQASSDDENQTFLLPGIYAIRYGQDKIRVPIKKLPGRYAGLFRDRPSDAASLLRKVEAGEGKTAIYLESTTLIFDLEPGDIPETAFELWKLSQKQKLASIEDRGPGPALARISPSELDREARGHTQDLPSLREILPPSVLPTETEKRDRTAVELPDQQETFDPRWFYYGYLDDYPFNQLSAIDFAIFLIHYTRSKPSKRTPYNFYSTMTDKLISTCLEELKLIWKKNPPRKFRGKIKPGETSISTIKRCHKKLWGLAIVIPMNLGKKGKQGAKRLVAMNPNQTKRRIALRNKQRKWVDKIVAKRKATRERNRSQFHPPATKESIEQLKILKEIFPFLGKLT